MKNKLQHPTSYDVYLGQYVGEQHKRASWCGKGIAGALALRIGDGGLKESFITGELSPLTYTFLIVQLPK